MIIDLHVHTRRHSGCSSIEPLDLIGRAVEMGLEGVALTEHGILWKEENLFPLQEEADKRGLTILAGEEVTCFSNSRKQDFLIFGLKRSLGSHSSPSELIRRVHDEGGIVIAAHPFKPSRHGIGYHGTGEDLYGLDVDAIELYHPDHTETGRKNAREAAKAMGIPMTGGSDAHELDRVGIMSTRFFHRIATAEELVREIRAGRIEPLQGRPIRARSTSRQDG